MEDKIKDGDDWSGIIDYVKRNKLLICLVCLIIFASFFGLFRNIIPALLFMIILSIWYVLLMADLEDKLRIVNAKSSIYQRLKESAYKLLFLFLLFVGFFWKLYLGNNSLLIMEVIILFMLPIWYLFSSIINQYLNFLYRFTIIFTIITVPMIFFAQDKSFSLGNFSQIYSFASNFFGAISAFMFPATLLNSIFFSDKIGSQKETITKEGKLG